MSQTGLVTRTWAFRLALQEDDDFLYPGPELLSKLNQITHATYVLTHGIPTVQFERSALTPIGALLSAHRDLHKLGVKVMWIEDWWSTDD